MKKRLTVISMAFILPLVVVGVLALFGITFSSWVYLLISTVCLIDAGILWFIYKDMERKIADAESGRLRK